MANVEVPVLDVLATPASPKSTLPRSNPVLEPVLIAAAAAVDPRNYQHTTQVSSPTATDDTTTKTERKRLSFVSRQTARMQRLENEEGKENESEPLKSADNLPAKKRRSSIVSSPTEPRTRSKSITISDATKTPKLEVKCMARTRIPTPHGPAFLHLYHNNRDNKEHLAIVVDTAQLENDPNALVPPIRSKSLDAVWSETESEMDRIIRGAYVGRLSSTHQKASDTPTSTNPRTLEGLPAPLIRIHSECFTGETVGSMRCDCGEQLDEAIRQISQPITIPSSGTTIPGRGAVIYLRQEGRGIGLLSKIRAYNLQDMGHDTVTANLMLGHKADERGYEIAAAILRDLGLGFEAAACSDEVRILTNNPDKVEALKKEGIQIVDRVPMVPRSWQSRQQKAERTENGAAVVTEKVDTESAGLTLIGGKAVYGDDLDKYLRTKVLRMGHMLPLWLEEAST